MDERKDKERNPKAQGRYGRTVLLSVLVLTLAAAALLPLPGRTPPRSAQAAPLQVGPARYVCSVPDDDLPDPGTSCAGDWVQVEYVMEDSGCPEADGECWTDWALSKAYAWYECGSARRNREKGVGGGNPPDGFDPHTVADPRARCNDKNCIKQWAKGWWYVNAVARPVFPEDPGWGKEGGMVYECTWEIDPTHFYWFFGEEGKCYACDSCTVHPTATPPPPGTPTATPRPTECLPGTPTPLPTGTAVPPTPTRLPLPEAVVSPYALARSPRTPPGTWYRTVQDFYWLYQERLYIKLWGEAAAEAPPGCSLLSARVVRTYLNKVNGRQVCPDPEDPDGPFPAPEDTLYTPGAFCGWRDDTDDDAMVLLWSNHRMPPRGREDSPMNQYNVTPWTQTWIPIEYTADVAVTYTCGALTETAHLYVDGLQLRVKLVKPVRAWRR